MGTIADGNTIYADDILGSMRTTAEAGENLTAGNVGYIRDTDGKIYHGDTGNATDYKANGIIIATVTSGADATIITKGKYVTTGLTDKEVYYLGASGAISTTASNFKIGSADGTTNLYIAIEDLRSEGWIHIETLTPGAGLSVTSTGTLEVYDMYKVVYRLVGTTTDAMRMQFNADTGNNYSQHYVESTTITVFGSGKSGIVIGSNVSAVTSFGELMFPGITTAVANGALAVTVNHGGWAGGVKGFQGAWYGGNATQITSFTLYQDNYNFSGTIEIFGRNAK